MPRGGFGFGPGMGFARGSGFGRGTRGNWGANCRVFPWMPRRWWAGYNFQADTPMPVAVDYPQESEYLKNQAQFLKAQLEAVEKRLEQLVKKNTDK